ncbi:MAG: nucleotidyltransferase domain-containing protein [Desulfovibrio sp.]|jgi:predicted nucleotidyltransferase|nr:nucleotidyltransferase domain-containing protein [Desulfovibrio sp.]
MLQDVLDKHAPNAKILAYGSTVNGTHRLGSDPDLCLSDPSDPERLVGALQKFLPELNESDIPILVDVHECVLFTESFRQQIAKTGICLR